jgi:hypothetical protein
LYSSRVTAARPFLLSALLLIGACLAVVRSQAFAENPDVAAWGVTFDLTITLPLLYWFFVVRRGKASALTIVPVFLAGILLSSLLLPAAQQQFLRQLKWTVVPLVEVLVVVALVRHGRNSCVAEAVLSELTMLRYALFGWRKKPEEGVTFHERNGWGTIVVCILVLLAAEGIGMHLLLRRWSVPGAWVWTGLEIWGALWLIGDYHGLRVHRSTIDAGALRIRFGLRWNVDVPRELVASVSAIGSESEWKRKDVMKIAVLEDPRWLVTLREPVVVRGMMGLRRTVTALALLPDDEEWLSALRSGSSESEPRAELR